MKRGCLDDIMITAVATNYSGIESIENTVKKDVYRSRFAYVRGGGDSPKISMDVSSRIADV